MIHTVDVQYGIDGPDLPKRTQVTLWANAALQNIDTAVELSIRIVDELEGTQLNEQWSKKTGPTNVLSFPFEGNEEMQPKLLGDVVLCAPVIAREAFEQDKSVDAHWAHMIIHGTLHLLGYDHIEGQQIEIMESLEIKILNKLNFNNPYT
ncbi:MAG: putative rRNA maturation factor [Gammaproteobacteria bacterium]